MNFDAGRTPASWPLLCVLPGTPQAAGVARRLAHGLLGAAHPLVDTAMLLVTELVTNSVMHSRSGAPGGTVTVGLCSGPGGVLIEVRDEGAGGDGACDEGARDPGALDEDPCDQDPCDQDPCDQDLCDAAARAVLRPAAASPAPPAEHGYGLLLVAALADTWGTASGPEGRVTWCRLGGGESGGDGSG